MTTETEWINRFMNIAEEVGSWSKDPSRGIGAVIVDINKRIVSTGFNGFPQNIKDDEEELADRDTKLAKTIHAETNAILFAQRDLTGCTIYCTLIPCSRCAALIIQSGITAVVAYDNTACGTGYDFKMAQEMFKEARVHSVIIKKEDNDT